MTFFDPRLKPQFDSLSKELQQVIMEKDVQIHSLQDLIQCLEDIVNE